MYDKLLAKETFFLKLKEAGCTDEEAEKGWVVLKNMFFAKVFKNSCDKIPADKLKEIFGKEQIGIDELEGAAEKLMEYIGTHQEELDFGKIISDSSVQALEQMKEELTKGAN